jgi:hypothetical protein
MIKDQDNIVQDYTLHSDIEDPGSNKKMLWFIRRKMRDLKFVYRYTYIFFVTSQDRKNAARNFSDNEFGCQLNL